MGLGLGLLSFRSARRRGVTYPFGVSTLKKNRRKCKTKEKSNKISK